MKILDMERHGHEAVATEGTKGQSILPQRLHVFADGFREDSEGGQAREESEEGDDE